MASHTVNPLFARANHTIWILMGLKQCCGAGAGGAEIILGPGAGAEN